VDKDLFFKPRLAEEDIEISGIGTIRIRALSRAEALRIENSGSHLTSEAQILSWGIVDPTFTIAEINRWLEAAPAGELQEVSRRIAVLSGMLEDSAKAAYKSAGDDTDAGV
jgi:hypothetical protein